jgi:hypothetical protein
MTSLEKLLKTTQNQNVKNLVRYMKISDWWDKSTCKEFIDYTNGEKLKRSRDVCLFIKEILENCDPEMVNNLASESWFKFNIRCIHTLDSFEEEKKRDLTFILLKNHAKCKGNSQHIVNSWWKKLNQSLDHKILLFRYEMARDLLDDALIVRLQQTDLLDIVLDYTKSSSGVLLPTIYDEENYFVEEIRPKFENDESSSDGSDNDNYHKKNRNSSGSNKKIIKKQLKSKPEEKHKDDDDDDDLLSECDESDDVDSDTEKERKMKKEKIYKSEDDNDKNNSYDKFEEIAEEEEEEEEIDNNVDEDEDDDDISEDF